MKILNRLSSHLHAWLVTPSTKTIELHALYTLIRHLEQEIERLTQERDFYRGNTISSPSIDEIAYNPIPPTRVPRSEMKRRVEEALRRKNESGDSHASDKAES